MNNNDVIRSVRYMLDISDAKVAAIFALGDFDATKADIIDLLKKDEEEGFLPCDDDAMAHFLNGLVIYRRGKNDAHPAVPMELPLDNNKILKKLRVAFELKDDDMQAILDSAGFLVSKQELSAFFRKTDHKNYRPCGDQFMRNFLKGLTMRFRS